MLERDAELETIDALLTSAPDGRGFGLVIEGEAGIGKSSLIRVACERARDRGFETLAARGGALERDFGYGVVRQLFEPRMLRASPNERDALLAGAAGLAAPIVAGGDVSAAGAAGSPDAPFAGQHGLYWLAENLASSQPLLLMVDDAHWADLPSLRFLAYLARRLDGVPAGFLVGVRTGEPGSPTELLDELRGEPLVEVLRPDRLSEAAVGHLIREQISDAADPDFCRACHVTTGGNPFLLSELVTAVSRGQLGPSAESAGRVRELGPDAISRSVFVRLSRLSPEATAVARAVAVLDVDSDVRHVAGLAGLATEVALAAAAELEQAEILVGSRPLAFVHPILRGAVYGDLGAAEREVLHSRAARILEGAGATERAAAHLLLTEPAGDGWVAEALTLAAEAAISRGAPDTAVRLLERALAESPASAPARAHYLLGTAHQLLGRPSAADWLRRAMIESEESQLRWQAARRLARQFNIRAQHREAVTTLEDVLDEQRAADPKRALATEAEIAIFGAFPDESARDAGARVERVAAERPGDSTEARMILVALAFHRALAMNGTADEVADQVLKALADGRFIELLPDTSTAFWGCAALIWAGRPDDARVLSDSLLGHARETGGAIWVSAAASWRSLAAFALGDLRDAEAYAHESLDNAPGNFPLAQVGIAGFLAESLVLRGELEAADATLAASGYADEPPPLNALSLYLLRARILVRLEQRRCDDAVRDAGAILLSEQQRGGLIPGMRLPAALALHAAGQFDSAQALVQRELDAAERWGVAGYTAAALRTLAMLEGGSSGIDRLRQAVGIVEGTPFRLELALSLTEYGAALRRDNQRRAARDPLERGMETAHRCGATVLADRAQEELRATGARPRSLVLSGVDALTPSERRVAQMAASGMANREIAQALFVTKKTVETHLRHVFQKLDLSARTELAAALEETPTFADPEAPPGDLVRPVVVAVAFVEVVGRGDSDELYEKIVRRELAAFSGSQAKPAGGRRVLTFDSATQAVRCVQRLTACVASEVGLQLRGGVHCGELEFSDDAVRGLAADVAKRVTALAAPGEVLCTGTVADVAVGSEIPLADRGSVELEGLPGEWRIYSAT